MLFSKSPGNYFYDILSEQYVNKRQTLEVLGENIPGKFGNLTTEVLARMIRNEVSQVRVVIRSGDGHFADIICTISKAKLNFFIKFKNYNQRIAGDKFCTTCYLPRNLVTQIFQLILINFYYVIDIRSFCIISFDLCVPKLDLYKHSHIVSLLYSSCHQLRLVFSIIFYLSSRAYHVNRTGDKNNHRKVG